MNAKTRRTSALALGAVSLALVATACNGADYGGNGSGGDKSGHGEHGAAGTTEVASLKGISKNRGGAVFFAGSLNGANEVPADGGPAVGDKDGAALAFLRVQGEEVSFAFRFRGIATPTAAHIHQGARGANGNVRIPFFAEKQEDGETRVSGSVKVTDAQLLNDLKNNPNGFYFNLHTGEFPGGAVRGQVFKLGVPVDMRSPWRNFQSSVVRGVQIYACTRQADGSYAFTQDNVRAALAGNIAHSFVQPAAGPPQWIAPDRSGVTGKLLSKVPNGERNIAELDLAATQIGRKGGLLSGVREILRLNTVGGVAPAGACEAGTRAEVPYGADYLFIGR